MECSDFQTSLNSSMHTHTRAVSRVVGKRPTTCFDGPRIDQSEEMQRTRQKKSSFPPLFFPFSERGRVNITSVGCSGLQCWESGRTSDWMKSSASSIFSLLHKDPIAPRSISLRTDLNKFRESNENLAQATATVPLYERAPYVAGITPHTTTLQSVTLCFVIIRYDSTFDRVIIGTRRGCIN